MYANVCVLLTIRKRLTRIDTIINKIVKGLTIIILLLVLIIKSITIIITTKTHTSIYWYNNNIRNNK